MLTALLLALLAAPASMGELSFEVSGSPECKQKFKEGMLALHSFMYDQAHRRFAAAVAADPGCAMARWGDAMAHSKPLWGTEDAPAARAALAAVGDESGLTAKERAYLHTARALFGEGELPARLAAWREAAERMQRDYPDDDEPALQYALSLVADNDWYRDVKRSMQGASLAMDVFARHPEHPGAAHYLIHSCDTPEHAILALPAAKRYARIAPAASHARHMPSHIFVQLGMYAESAASNEDSWAASVAEPSRPGAPKEAHGDFHSYSWLAASYFELGQRKKAEELLAGLRARIAKADVPYLRFAYASIVTMDLTHGQRKDRLDELLAPLEKPLPREAGEAESSLGCALHAPGGSKPLRPPFGLWSLLRGRLIRAEAAARAGDVPAVSAALAKAEPIYAALEAWKSVAPPGSLEVRRPYADALTALTKARASRSFAEAQRALEAVVAVPRPGPVGPAFEPLPEQFLAQALLESGNAKAALAGYDRVLTRHPNLSTALLGAARAAKAAGLAAVARDRYAALAALWARADADLPDLEEVRAGASGPSAAR